MIGELSPHDLSWDDVDPARHPFDSAAAARVVRSLGPARRIPGGEGKLWADAMSYALVEQYGRWALGWRWAQDEGDFDGGPVGSWCCPRDSITTPEETLERVVAGLCEWRAWLESLAGWFEAYPLDVADIEGQRVLWECATRNLILQVVDRTGCGSGWYGHCRQVLTWFLSRWGVAPATAHELVEQAIGGRFRSWTDPDAALVGDIAERLPKALRPDDRARPAEPATDHLGQWLAVRETVAWQEVPGGPGVGPVRPARDGAVEDVIAFDGALDPTRAEGLLTALERLRAEAAQGTPLDFERLQGWQQHVLGSPQPPAFRVGTAFAKNGRERYGMAPDTRARLDSCLAESAEADGESLPLTARAARAYLDVCFFHPFDDGNARSAFLAAVFVLAREGVVLDDVSLLRRITFRADSREDALALARYLDLHLAETRHTAASAATHPAP
ncbi:Fic family protein [Streptomyces sp. NPDC046876]|uniref:Fic family protein n=1 Tax=Streptomyces sp. NPDC046876 TaxID=3155616 RepID=UPI0033F7C5F6